jgi:hypothetical protein
MSKEPLPQAPVILIYAPSAFTTSTSGTIVFCGFKKKQFGYIMVSLRKIEGFKRYLCFRTIDFVTPRI